MMHARSPYAIFREIAAFLSVAFFLLPGRLSARDSRSDTLIHRSVPARTLSSYTPGSIPIQEAVSPSGGRIYSIHIALRAEMS